MADLSDPDSVSGNGHDPSLSGVGDDDNIDTTSDPVGDGVFVDPGSQDNGKSAPT